MQLTTTISANILSNIVHNASEFFNKFIQCTCGWFICGCFHYFIVGVTMDEILQLPNRGWSADRNLVYLSKLCHNLWQFKSIWWYSSKSVTILAKMGMLDGNGLVLVALRALVGIYCFCIKQPLMFVFMWIYFFLASWDSLSWLDNWLLNRIKSKYTHVSIVEGR